MDPNNGALVLAPLQDKLVRSQNPWLTQGGEAHRRLSPYKAGTTQGNVNQK